MVYFAALGIGFIFIEIGLMQRFILFLGHPTFALSVVLFALLTFSGIGSFLTGKLAPPGTDTRRVLRFVIPGLALLVLAYMLALPPLFRAALGWDLLPRVLLSVVFLAPLGLLMGMPFPLGIRLVAATNEPLVPWAWGVNGCASVLGSILSVMLAQSLGFTAVLGITLAVYLIGLAALMTLRTGMQPAPSASPALTVTTEDQRNQGSRSPEELRAPSALRCLVVDNHIRCILSFAK